MKYLLKIIRQFEVLILDIQRDKKKTLLFTLVFIIILYMDFSFIMKTQFIGSRGLRTKIIKLKTSVSNLNKDLSLMRNQKERSPQSRENTTLKIKEFISGGQIPSLMKEISDIAVKNSVKIMQIKPSQEQIVKKDLKNALTEKFTPLYITLDLISDYHKLGAFIGDIGNSKIFFAVENMKILPDKNDCLLENISLVLKTYVKK